MASYPIVDGRSSDYPITGIEWHVDHIIPLKGREICGLHLWTNLRLIPKLENLRKGNKSCLL